MIARKVITRPVLRGGLSPAVQVAHEPPGRALWSHQKRAGLGVWAAARSHEARDRIKSWKRSAPFDPAESAAIVQALAALARAWSPILPPGTVATVPPQGASAPGPYAAFTLAAATAEALGVPFALMLSRTDEKRWHGPLHALRQSPFTCDLPAEAPAMALVLDDLITSGATMKLSLSAIRAAGVAAFGFAFSGC